MRYNQGSQAFRGWLILSAQEKDATLAHHSNTTLVLKYYLLLRCLIVLGLAAGIAMISVYFNLSTPLLPCLVIVAVLAAATWLTTLRKSLGTDKLHTDLLCNLLIDIAALFVFTYYTGGSTNPFVTLFALPVIFAAATLPMSGSAIIALAAIASYTITMFVSAPLDPGRMQINVSNEYLWGNWYAFVLVVAGITALVARLSRSVKQQDQALSATRQDALQADRAIALGTLAARAAQDLGTPLATIAVLARDLEKEAQNADTRQRLETLNTAVGTCKDILSNLAADAGQQRADQGHAISADSYVAELVEQWASRHPNLNAELQQNGPQPAPEILTDKALDQALLTLLDCATDFSSDRNLIVSGNWSTDVLDIGVQAVETDPANARAGILPTESMDTGLFLAVATLKRMGGNVNFNPVGGAGNAIELSIPLNTIRTS